MFNNVALDVAIGLIFVYVLYSLLGTLIQEIIATNIGLRGWMLNKAIKRMLDDDKKANQQIPKSKLSDLFYSHPLIKYLAPYSSFVKNKKPSYITSETFSKVVIDLLRGQNPKPGSSDRQPIQTSLDNKEAAWDTTVSIEAETLSYLNSIWADSQGDVQKFKASLEQWFNEMMDRTTGWYKKYTQIILLFIGLLVAGLFNVDTIKIIKILQNNPSIREQVLAQASAFVKSRPNLDKDIAITESKIDSLSKIKTKSDTGVEKNIQTLNASLKVKENAKAMGDTLYKQATTLVGSDINKVNSVLGLGWNNKDNFSLLSIVGWILTALAISLGASFWFDLLNKLMQLRSSIAPKDDSKSKSDSSSKITERVG